MTSKVICKVSGIGNMTGDQLLPGYRGGLNRQCVALAEALRPAGNRTYMVGKWHVTATEYEHAIEGSRDNWPPHAWPRDIGKRAGRYDVGWDVLRDPRYRRQVEMGLIDPDWPVSPRASEKPVPGNSTAAQAWEDVEDKAYQAMLIRGSAPRAYRPKQIPCRWVFLRFP